MSTQFIVSGVVLEEVSLTTEELAFTCAVDVEWIVERVEAGLLGSYPPTRERWRFASHEVIRARRMVALERDMDANPEVAALVVDLIEEVRRLRERVGNRG